MNTIIRWILLALLIIFIAWIVPGITVSNFISALLVVLVIGLINAFIKPFVEFIALPINFLTLGLFGLVINALLFILAGKIAPGFQVEGFWNALLGSVILSVLTPLINNLTVKKDK